MSIDYAFSQEGDLLRVQATGQDESLADTLAYSQAVMQEASRQQASRILCDERKVVYRLGVMDTYALAEAIVQVLPGVARVAIVHPEEAEGAFFETVVRNRGMLLRVFDALPEAEAWLAEGPA